jgi:hypothetical protein
MVKILSAKIFFSDGILMSDIDRDYLLIIPQA